MKPDVLLEEHRVNDMSAPGDAQAGEEEREKKPDGGIKKTRGTLKRSTPSRMRMRNTSGSRGNENKSNITGNQSAKLKSSHGVIQGYNGLAAVDDKYQLITAADCWGEQGEAGHLEELAEQTKENLGLEDIEGKKILADTGYFSEENCQYLENGKADGYVPDPNFRKREEVLGFSTDSLGDSAKGIGFSALQGYFFLPCDGNP